MAPTQAVQPCSRQQPAAPLLLPARAHVQGVCDLAPAAALGDGVVSAPPLHQGMQPVQLHLLSSEWVGGWVGGDQLESAARSQGRSSEAAGRAARSMAAHAEQATDSARRPAHVPTHLSIENRVQLAALALHALRRHPGLRAARHSRCGSAGKAGRQRRGCGARPGGGTPPRLAADEPPDHRSARESTFCFSLQPSNPAAMLQPLPLSRPSQAAHLVLCPKPLAGHRRVLSLQLVHPLHPRIELEARPVNCKL